MKKQSNKKQHEPDSAPAHALELFQPRPNVLYSLDVAAHIAGVPRRSLLVYCRAGLVRNVFQPPYGVLAFTEEAIRTARRIEEVRAAHAPNLFLLKVMFDLVEEVDHLRAEVRFLRQH